MNPVRWIAGSGIGAVVAIVVGGCVPMSEVTPYDIGGSKADGTVVVGANVRATDEIDWQGAEALALERCGAWGYSGAEAFTGVRERCMQMGTPSLFNPDPCLQKEITRTYQCID